MAVLNTGMADYPAKMPDPVLAVNELAKNYGKKTVISGVTLTVEPGEIVALVGANGGGKTTTLRMLVGLLSPDAGAGQVLGRDVRSPETADRASIGYMTQRVALYPELSVLQNLQFRAAIFALPDAKSRIDEMVDRFGLAPYIKARADSLSGGWARRVQFASSLMNKPTLLLLDEPPAGLDSITKRNIWGHLHELAAGGTGIVISTHDLIEAEQCPKLLFYNEGVAHGPMTPAALREYGGARTLDDAVSALARSQRV